MKKIPLSPDAIAAHVVRWSRMISALLVGLSGLVHAADAHRAEIFVQRGHGNSWMEDARFVDTDRYLIFAGSDGKAVLWDANSMREIRAVAAHRVKITALGTTLHADVVATGDADGNEALYRGRRTRTRHVAA